MNKPVIRSDRADGRYDTLAGVVHHRYRCLAPKLAYDPTWSKKRTEAWRGQVRRKLRELTGLKRPTKQPAPVMVDDQAREGYRLQRWELYPDDISVVPMLMMVPDAATARDPAGAVLCLPGSDHPMERLAGEPEPEGNGPNRFPVHNAMGLHFVRQGLIALIVENPGTGSMADGRGGDWMRESLELLWLGESYEGVSLAHKVAAFRWLKKHRLVDGKRIAACGHSLGGKVALLLGLIEPGLAAVVWNSLAYDHRLMSVHTNLERIAPWQYVPGLLEWFDYLDLMAALAPTPLMLSEGGRSDQLRKVRKAYELAGAKTKLKIAYSPSRRKAAGRRLDRRTIPEGITRAEYVGYLSGAAEGEHRFQFDTVVPWLVKVLRK